MKGYQALYQLLKDTVLKKGIKKSIFPIPKKLRLAKRVCNDDVKRIIGEFYYIEDTLNIATRGKKRGKDGNVAYPYSEFNNIFID